VGLRRKGQDNPTCIGEEKGLRKVGGGDPIGLEFFSGGRIEVTASRQRRGGSSKSLSNPQKNKSKTTNERARGGGEGMPFIRVS